MAEETQQQVKQKKGFFRGLMSTFFDVPRWVNAQQYVQTNKTLRARLMDTFRIRTAQRTETFESAIERLKLTEQDLQMRLKINSRTLVAMSVFIGLLFCYLVYLVFYGALAGSLIVLALIFLSFVRAFQCSFWNFQIKNRRLGCTFQDWLKGEKF